MAKTDPRTSKSIKNSSVALVLYFINLILQSFSRKFFSGYLGAEVLGLNTTATNLLQFLNLAELGVGPAISCTLYKPLAEKDTNVINEIISLQGRLYRRIAWIVIAGNVVLMTLFPWIFAKMPSPLWYAYASFEALLVSALLSYFINCKQIVLSADQQEYKIQYSYKASMLAKPLCQILAIRYLSNGYVWWLILEMMFTMVASAALNRVVARTYPCLKTDLYVGKELARKYPDVLTEVKQLFFHKIAGFALMQNSPVIIYAYTILAIVALYGNYVLIVMGVQTLMMVLFNNVNAGVGNLIAEEDKRKIMSVFAELFFIRFLFSRIICFGVLLVTLSLVSFWIGKEYVVDSLSLLLTTATLFINLSRTTVDTYVNAYGLFNDIWAPVIKASINVGLSIILGYPFGLHGMLSGVLISSSPVVSCWKPYYLFRKGLDESLRVYVFIYAKYLVITLLRGVIVFLGMRYSMEEENTTSFAGLLTTLVFSVLDILALFFVAQGMRNLMMRFVRMCHLTIIGG